MAVFYSKQVIKVSKTVGVNRVLGSFSWEGLINVPAVFVLTI